MTWVLNYLSCRKSSSITLKSSCSCWSWLTEPSKWEMATALKRSRHFPAGCVSTIYFSPVFTGFFSRIFFLQFSHEFSQEKVFSRKFLSIFFLDFSRVLSNSLVCFFVRSYLRSLKILIFGDWRRRNIRKATMMHLPKRCILDKNEFSRENKCSRNFLEKITATWIFSRKKLLQEFSRQKNCNRNFLEKTDATGMFSRK